MANTIPRIMELADRWREASTQLTGFVKTVKLTVTSFNALGPDGEAYFKQQAILHLMGPSEFVYDESSRTRVYFGNPIDIEEETGGFIYQQAGMRLPTLRPGYGGQIISTSFPNSFGAHVSNMDSPNTLHTQSGISLNMQVNAGQSFITNNQMVPSHAEGYQLSSQAPLRQTPNVSQRNSDSLQTIHPRENAKAPVGKESNNGTAVKQPQNGFVRWRRTYWEEVRKTNPELHQTTLSGMAKEQWDKMSAEEKEPWMSPARAELEEFKVQHPDYFKNRALKAAEKRKATPQEGENRAKRLRIVVPSPGQQLHTPVTQVQEPPRLFHEGGEHAAYTAPSSTQQPPRPIPQGYTHQAPVPMQQQIREPPKPVREVPESAPSSSFAPQDFISENYALQHATSGNLTFGNFNPEDSTFGNSATGSSNISDTSTREDFALEDFIHENFILEDFTFENSTPST
ncbi:hypothetical protein F5Y10DRAFT_289533 [Nemania abortiva]|nr:hypothetical protein F5Y10DRAFT_289533 [Nemania abortiva]